MKKVWELGLIGLIGVFILIIVNANWLTRLNQREASLDEREAFISHHEERKNNGRDPVLVKQTKVGDDVVPSVHQVWYDEDFEVYYVVEVN